SAESGERRRCPFPAVAGEVVNAECARSVQAARNWIPMCESVIAAAGVHRFFAGRRPKRGAVIFGFAHQALAAPLRIGRRLLLRGIAGRVERQRYELEHSAPEPLPVHALPEVRRRRAGRPYILEILAVRDFLPIDFECRYLDRMPRDLVVPREMIAGA